MMWKIRLVALLFPVAAFAGAGVNGGSGSSLDQVTFDLLYGTFSLGGSSFDYLATDAPLIIDDDGHDLLTSISLTKNLDPRIYAGITALLATGSIPVTLTEPLATCTTETSCTPDGTTTFSTTATTDDIAFSTGGQGEISDVADPAQIIAEAELLNLITSGTVSSSTPEGSLTFTVTTDEGVGSAITTLTTDYTINLKELDFNGTAPAGAAVPEPSSFAPALVCLVIFALARINKFGEAARRMASLARVNRRFPS